MKSDLTAFYDAIRANPGSDGTYSREAAIQAIKDGRPAYWARTTTKHSSTATLVDDANSKGLSIALSRFPMHQSEVLARLIPLNDAASSELAIYRGEA